MWLVLDTEFVEFAVIEPGVPSATERLAASVPPPVSPLPAVMETVLGTAPMSAGERVSWCVWLVLDTEFVEFAVIEPGVPSATERLAASVPPPVSPLPAVMETVLGTAPMSAGANVNVWVCPVADTEFCDVAEIPSGIPSVIVRFAVSVPPPVMPLPATICRLAIAFWSSAACRPTTWAISERANAKLSPASVTDTVSNAVTDSTFQPAPQSATAAPGVLYFARTSATDTVGYDQFFVRSPSQTHRSPAASEPKRTGRSLTEFPPAMVAPQRAHVFEVCA